MIPTSCHPGPNLNINEPPPNEKPSCDQFVFTESESILGEKKVSDRAKNENRNEQG